MAGSAGSVLFYLWGKYMISGILYNRLFSSFEISNSNMVSAGTGILLLRLIAPCFQVACAKTLYAWNPLLAMNTVLN